MEPSGWERPPISVPEMVHALTLFDEPMLNSRYHLLLLQSYPGRKRDELARLPQLVLASAHLARDAAAEWAKHGRAPHDPAFLEWANFALLEAFLSLNESQLRVLASIARFAPTAETRAPFERVALMHRHVAATLRDALREQAYRPAAPGGLRSVQEEGDAGDIRGQLERAVREATTRGSGVRQILLSHTALRHLRDQGAFADGDASLWGFPVVVDLGWDASAFVLQTFDQVTLEEILFASDPTRPTSGAQGGGGSPPPA